MKSLILLFVVLTLSSCAALDFFPERTYSDQMDRNDDPLFMPGEDFPVMLGDSGRQFRTREEILKRTPPSARQLAKMTEEDSLNRELVRRKNKLSEQERSRFESREDRFESIHHKLDFLRLSKRERTRRPASDELHLGMAKDTVNSHWGPPIKVEISGHPRQQNERWTYYRDGKLQYIFFEQGRLRGWSL